MDRKSGYINRKHNRILNRNLNKIFKRKHKRIVIMRFLEAAVYCCLCCMVVGCCACLSTQKDNGREGNYGKQQVDGQRVDGRAVYNVAQKASVEILVDGRIQGSGWFASKEGLVVTAAHVIGRQKENIEICRPGGVRLPAGIVAFDRGYDIVLLKAGKGVRQFPFLEVADRMPQPGQLVYFYGIALFHHGIMLDGMVSQDSTTYNYFSDRKMPMLAFSITAPSPPGTSGGPWIDRFGRVVGNQSGFVTHKGVGAGLAIVAPPGAIRRLVRTHHSVLTPSMGCGLEELWSQQKGFIRRFPKGTEGLVTIPIQKGGPAETAGLNKESLIIAIDGKPVCYRDKAYRQIHNMKPGDVIVLRVLNPDDSKPHVVRLKLGILGGEEVDGK